MQSLTPADVSPPFLLPSLGGGSRSLRHIVVLRRAKAHLEEVTTRLADPKPLDKEAAASVGKKLFLVKRHVEELEWYSTRHPRSRVVAGLKSLKEDFAAVVRAATEREEVKIKHRDEE
jgi:hypothetical protein